MKLGYAIFLGTFFLTVMLLPILGLFGYFEKRDANTYSFRSRRFLLTVISLTIFNFGMRYLLHVFMA